MKERLIKEFRKYDVWNDLMQEIAEECNEEDIEYLINNYITEEDEMLLGYYNLMKKIEDRDFVYNIYKELIPAVG